MQIFLSVFLSVFVFHKQLITCLSLSLQLSVVHVYINYYHYVHVDVLIVFNDFYLFSVSQVSKKRRAKVTYSYTPDNEDELTLQPGQIVEVIKEVEEGWLEGSLDGKVGVFPSNIVEPLKDVGDPVPPPQLPAKSMKN